MNERFKFYIKYPIGLHQMAIETTHQDWSSLVDSFKNMNAYKIEKHSYTEDICGEKHAFMHVYATCGNARFHIGWIDELID